MTGRPIVIGGDNGYHPIAGGNHGVTFGIKPGTGKSYQPVFGGSNGI